MNTLTKFITNNLNLDSHTQASHEGIMMKENTDSRYEIIENEVLKDSDLKGLNISGSLFSLTTFRNVTFESCVFFASRIENCEFINCNFINCEWRFTHIAHCNFTACEFSECNWELSPTKKTEFNFCTLDAKTAYFISKESTNEFSSCMSNREITWEEAFALEEQSTEEIEERDTTATLNLGALIGYFNQKKAA